MILDELPTLHQLPSLEPGLSESRQFGGCFVLGVQVFSALRDLYGRDLAQTISGLCGTRVVLASPDKDTSEWSAGSLGKVEVETLSEGVSYETPREGVTLSTRREERPLVLPSEVSRLENLSGYLKFPGPSPVARIRLKYRKRDIVAARFVPRPGRRPRSALRRRAAGSGRHLAGRWRCAGAVGGGACRHASHCHGGSSARDGGRGGRTRQRCDAGGVAEAPASANIADPGAGNEAASSPGEGTETAESGTPEEGKKKTPPWVKF